MKKIILLSLVILVAALLIASHPMPPPTQQISGTLRWTRSSTCMLQDYVALPVMENIYLRGWGFPTQGQFQGCSIHATGTYLNIGSCKVFQVTSSVITCSPSRPVPFIR